jgi:phosphatidate cytidylyltransferase
VASKKPDVRRLYVALVFIPLFYLVVRYAPPIAFFALVVIVALLALHEFYRLHFRDRRATMSVAAGLGFTAVLLVGLQWPGVVSERMVLLLAISAILVSRLFSTRHLRQSLTDSAVLAFGILYVGLTLGHLLMTRALPEGGFLIFYLVLVTWAGDTGAYYAGITLGRTKLAPVVSPNKTVEGLLGGLLFALVAAIAARAWFLPSLTVMDCVATAFLLNAAGVLGDLSESMLKRSVGVKDSGTLLPAHGGMLDRLDSLLFTAPAFYYYVTLVKGASL